MKFVDIVEAVEEIESKVGSLSVEKLGLLEAILLEGEADFDVNHHIDFLVEFVDAYSDEDAVTITESVDCDEVLKVILASSTKHTNDKVAFLSESVELAGDIDVLEESDEFEDSDEEPSTVTMLSVVTNTLTEMLGEEEVEGMPVEMVLDIVAEAQEMEVSDEAGSMNVVELVEEISTKLEESIKNGSIDLDTDDYEGETLAEFLSDYENTADLLEEMAKVTDEILAESDNQEAATVMGKARDAAILLEGKKKKKKKNKCKHGDSACKVKEGKKYYKKNKLNVGGEQHKLKTYKPEGKVGAYFKAAKKAMKAAAKKKGEKVEKGYFRYVLLPGLLRRMSSKGKKLKNS